MQRLLPYHQLLWALQGWWKLQVLRCPQRLSWRRQSAGVWQAPQGTPRAGGGAAGPRQLRAGAQCPEWPLPQGTPASETWSCLHLHPQHLVRPPQTSSQSCLRAGAPLLALWAPAPEQAPQPGGPLQPPGAPLWKAGLPCRVNSCTLHSLDREYLLGCSVPHQMRQTDCDCCLAAMLRHQLLHPAQEALHLLT